MTTLPPNGDQPARQQAEPFPDLVSQTQRRLDALPATQQVTLLLILARELAAEERIRSGRLTRAEQDARKQSESAINRRDVFEGFQWTLNRAVLHIHVSSAPSDSHLIEGFYRIASWFSCEDDVLHALHRVKRNPLHDREECPCCGYYTLSGRGDYEICEVCFWEDEWPHLIYSEPPEGPPTGANSVPLQLARDNFLFYGAMEERFTSNVRPPLPYELPEQGGW